VKKWIKCWKRWKRTSTKSQPPNHMRLVKETFQNASGTCSVKKSALTSYQDQQSMPFCNSTESLEVDFSSQPSYTPQLTYQKRTESKMGLRQQCREQIIQVICLLISTVKKFITSSDQAMSARGIRDMSSSSRLAEWKIELVVTIKRYLLYQWSYSIQGAIIDLKVAQATEVLFTHGVKPSIFSIF
jgi:hypothetical protein